MNKTDTDKVKKTNAICLCLFILAKLLGIFAICFAYTNKIIPMVSWIAIAIALIILFITATLCYKNWSFANTLEGEEYGS